MITGMSLHHFIAAVGFNALVPVCYLLLMQFFDIYLFGYNGSSFTYIMRLHPLIQSVDSSHFGVVESLIYLLIAAAITAFLCFCTESDAWRGRQTESSSRRQMWRSR